MIIQSVIPIYHNEVNQLRIVEWTTSIDERNNKVYNDSREYTIRLYSKDGLEREYNKRGNVDVYA